MCAMVPALDLACWRLFSFEIKENPFLFELPFVRSLVRIAYSTYDELGTQQIQLKNYVCNSIDILIFRSEKCKQMI